MSFRNSLSVYVCLSLYIFVHSYLSVFVCLSLFETIHNCLFMFVFLCLSMPFYMLIYIYLSILANLCLSIYICLSFCVYLLCLNGNPYLSVSINFHFSLFLVFFAEWHISVMRGVLFYATELREVSLDNFSLTIKC
jgi:hypothetical protein